MNNDNNSNDSNELLIVIRIIVVAAGPSLLRTCAPGSSAWADALLLRRRATT